MANGRDILKKATSHLGEDGNPTWKAYNEWGTGWAWCCAFVWRVFKECSASKLFYAGGKTAYVPTADNWFYQGGGEWVTYDKAQAGDVVIFTWNPTGAGNTRSGSRDHIGIFEERLSSTQFTAIEGNAGSPSRVRRMTRAKKNIFAIYRPKYPKTPQISEDGYWGKTTTKRLQEVLGTKQDGIISGQLNSCKKYLENCETSSWKFASTGKGSQVIKALQKMVGVTQDGLCGKQTVIALQRFLGVTADGYCGKKTVTALQKWLNKQ